MWEIRTVRLALDRERITGYPGSGVLVPVPQRGLVLCNAAVFTDHCGRPRNCVGKPLATARYLFVCSSLALPAWSESCRQRGFQHHFRLADHSPAVQLQ